MSKEAEEFLTQENIDKLQYETDDDNGIVDLGLIAQFMEAYHQHKLSSPVVEQEEKKEYNYECSRCGITYTQRNNPLPYSNCQRRNRVGQDLICGGELIEINQ